MGVTIYDLAREAGVGIGTVSRCLNNHPSVSAHTREKVLSVARRLSYQPYAHAQRLASRRANTVSAVIPYFTNYFFVQVLQGVQDKAMELGFDLVLYGLNSPPQAEQYLRRSLQRGRVDGVLFFSMQLPESFAAKFEQMQLPLVLVDSSHPRFDSIRVENRQGSYLATTHLLKLGHCALAMVNADPVTLPSRERLAGFRDALVGAGLSFSESRVFSSHGAKLDGFSRESGHQQGERLVEYIRAGNPVTGVIVASDIQALGVREVLEGNGFRVPEDIALVGFDNIELAEHTGLTTMRQPMYEIGALALEKLYARIQNPDAPPTLTSFVPELIIRKTCGAGSSTAAEATADRIIFAQGGGNVA